MKKTDMKKMKQIIFSVLFLMLNFLMAEKAFALKCLEGPENTGYFDIRTAGNIKHTTETGIVNIINIENKEGVNVWQDSYSTTLTCYDDRGTHTPEEVKIYPDDNSHSFITALSGKNISAGFIFNNKEYIITDDLAQHGIPTGITVLTGKPNQLNCQKINAYSRESCSPPTQITINYSLFLKSNKSGDKFDAVREFQMFQIDGSLARNDTGSFGEYINLKGIKYISCIPQLTTQDVDLGVYNSTEQLGVILKKTPFTITVETKGNDCPNVSFRGIITSPSTKENNTIKTTNSAVGIQIFEADSGSIVEFGKNIDFGYSESNVITKNFEAGVIFSSKPAVGEFTGILNYQIWLK